MSLVLQTLTTWLYHVSLLDKYANGSKEAQGRTLHHDRPAESPDRRQRRVRAGGTAQPARPGCERRGSWPAARRSPSRRFRCARGTERALICHRGADRGSVLGEPTRRCAVAAFLRSRAEERVRGTVLRRIQHSPNRLGSTAVAADFVQRCMRDSRSRSIVLLLLLWRRLRPGRQGAGGREPAGGFEPPRCHIPDHFRVCLD